MSAASDKLSAKPTPEGKHKKRADRLEAELERLRNELAHERGRRVMKFGSNRPKSQRGIIRVTFGDSHGMRIDKAAAAALCHDLKLIQPDEIIHGGDCLDCDGFLTQHKAVGYTSLSEYSYPEDIGAANDFLDAIQKAVPKCRFDLIEGNHESRLRAWCLDNSKNDADFAYHWNNNGPPNVLSLEKRGISWWSRGEKHDGLRKRGTIKRGKMLYVHGDSHSLNAGAVHLRGSGTNVTYFHTHRADVQYSSTEASGPIAAFNSGCLCELHPMWRHSAPSTWTQGYGLEFVKKSGEFLKVIVPIVDGQSLLSPMVKAMGM